MTTEDTKSLEELSQLAVDRANELLDRAEAQARAMGVDLEASVGDPASESAAQDIDQASGGDLAADDYLDSGPAPSYSSTDSVFELRFETIRSQLLVEASLDVNVFTRQALVNAGDVLTELDVLLAEIGAEALKIAAASAAGYLVPPSRADVQDLRDQTQETHDRTRDSATNLASSRARRTAAKRQLQDDELVDDAVLHVETQAVRDRYLEPMDGPGQTGRNEPTTEGDAYFASARDRQQVSQRQSGATGRVDDLMREAASALQSSALDKLGFIAICMAIASLDRQQSTKDRALRLMDKIRSVIDQVMSSLEVGFVRDLQGQMQELAVSALSGIADSLQSKLDAFDTWLGLSFPELPTFVSLVESIGDTASDLPVLESLAGFCDLNLTSFCEFQRLLEAAKSLDAEICNLAPRDLTPVGRVRLLVQAPEPDDAGRRPVTEDLPDQETSMLLVQVITTPGSEAVVARMPRARKRSRSSQATTEDFQGDFEPSPNIRGGAGSLELRGDGEVLEALDYSSSDFDPVTGYHTFYLTSAPAEDHVFQVLGRPVAQSAQILYKGADLRTPAQRFNIAGAEITHPTDPNYDFSTFIADSADYRGTGLYRLKIGSFEYPVELDATTVLSGAGTKLVLPSAFYGGNQTGVVLSRVYAPKPPAANQVLVRLNQRLRDDLLVSGGSSTVAGRAIVDGGQGTQRLAITTTSIIDNGMPRQTLVVKEPMVRGDEVGMLIEVQSGASAFRVAIDDVDPVTNDITYDAPALLGTVSVSGATVNGDANTRFLNELSVGDYVYIPGLGSASDIEQIDSIGAQNQLTLANGGYSVGAGAAIHMVAPVGAFLRTATVWREPQETLDFSGITQVDGDIHALQLTGVSNYSHGLQEPEVTPTVRIVPGSIDDYRQHFQAAADNVVSRYNENIVPPGATRLTAVLEDDNVLLVPGMVDLITGATKFLYGDQEVVLSPLATDNGGGSYTFYLASPLVFAIPDDDVIEIETTNVFDQLQSLFPDDSWSSQIDDWFADLGSQLSLLYSKLCRTVSGRPVDIGLTATAVNGTVGLMRAQLLVIRLALGTLTLGLPESEKLTEAVGTLRESGMDAAADAAADGDLNTLSTMSADTATSEGRARKSIEDYDPHLVLYSDARTGEDVKASLTASEYDKRILATVRSPFTDLVRVRVERRRQAALVIKAKVEEIT